MAKDTTIPITGAKVHSYSVRTVKDVEKMRIVLEIDVDEITKDLGDVQKALLAHKQGDYEVGLNVLACGTSVASVPADEPDDDFTV